MRKDVKELIDKLFTATAYISCPDGARKFKSYNLKHIIITFFDIQIISDDEKNHPYKPIGLYWCPNAFTESGSYFLQYKNVYLKKLDKIIKEARKEYKKLHNNKIVFNLKKAGPNHILNYLESMKIADQKIDLLWKKILQQNKLKDIATDFV